MKSLKSIRDQCLKEPRLQPFQDLWESASASFDSDHHPDAIDYLTAAVAEIEQSVLAVTLLKRAMAFSYQGNFPAAIKDIDKVMELAPTLFEGYLCAGRLLQLAGENSRAVAVYKKGLGAVSGQCSEYEQLFRAKRALEDQIHETNTVLFKKVPYELLVRIFGGLLSFKDRLQCMFTCRAWQDFFLEDLPRASRQVILGTMPNDSMARLLRTISTSHHDSRPKSGVQAHQVSIPPGISVIALKNALNLLSQDTWHGQIEYLDICADLDSVPNMSSMLEKVLQRNNSSMKRVTICSVKNSWATVDTLNACSKVSHLVVAAHHSLLENNTSSVTTHSGKKVISDGTLPTTVTIAYGRERIISAARNGLGNNPLTMSANPVWLAEQQYRATHQRLMQNNFTRTHHMALKQLELVGMETSYFLYYTFWERLPNLEHISFKYPIDHPGDVQSITRNIGQYCLKLKTFRYGGGWQGTSCNEDGVIPMVEEAHGQEGLQEIIVRNSTYNRVGDLHNAMIVPNLISGDKNYSALTVLILQMEALTLTGLQTLTSLHLPRLTELQLHQVLASQAYRIRQEHFAPIPDHFPALEKIVLNNVQTCDNGLFELSKARRLRFAHLRVISLNQPPEHMNNLQRSLMLNQMMRMQLLAATRNGNVDLTAGPPAGVPLPAYTAPPPHDTTLKVYTKFINNCTMLTEVCLCGPAVQDANLYTLVTNNRNLSTVNLILCPSLTNDGIASAFNCVEDGILSSHPSNIRHITLANMLIDGGAAVSSLTRLCSLKKLTIIGCIHQDSQVSIVSSLKYDPARKSALEVYYLQNLDAREGILYECIPGQRSVLTRPVPSISIVKPFADFL